VRESATPTASAAAGSRTSWGSTQAIVSAAFVALAAIRQASAVRPALRAPASSVTRPRGRPPASTPSSAARPVGSRGTGEVEVPRRIDPGRPNRSSRAAAAFGTDHVSSFLRLHVNGEDSAEPAPRSCGSRTRSRVTEGEGGGAPRRLPDGAPQRGRVHRWKRRRRDGVGGRTARPPNGTER